MEFHELYEALRYTIPCRKCGGGGGTDGANGNPCPVCIGAGIEAVSASDVIIERQVLNSYRFFVFNGFADPDTKLLEKV